MSQTLTASRSLRSARFYDLASIYDPGVNLCIVEREPPAGVPEFIDALFASQASIEVTRTIRLGQFDGHDLLSALQQNSLPHGDAWRRDIVMLADMFADLFESQRIGLRLRTLHVAMCPRFHTDFVPVRLVCTYGGPGTEWLPDEAVDRRRLGSNSGGVCNRESGAILREKAVRQIPAYAVALLKGERWSGNEGQGVVHRSPQPKAGTVMKRLLLTLDLN